MNAIVGRRIVRLGSAGQPTSSKYRNKPTVVDGIRWASKKQALRYRELRMLESIGMIRNLKWEQTFALKVRDILICKYRADFVYEELVDSAWYEIVEDVEGQRDGNPYRLFKIKAALMLGLLNIVVREV